jgi:AcrR family transcriptional regulator
VGLRERKKADTRYTLMIEALRLFKERGYDHVSVEEIAAAANVSPRTFFRYCPTKAHVVFAWNELRLAQLDAMLRAREPGERVIDVVRRFWESFEDVRLDPDLFLVQQQLAQEREAVAAVRYRVFENARVRIHTALLEEDPARDPLEADLVASAAVNSVLCILRAWVRSGKGDPYRFLDQAWLRVLETAAPLYP